MHQTICLALGYNGYVHSTFWVPISFSVQIFEHAWNSIQFWKLCSHATSVLFQTTNEAIAFY